MVTYDNFIDINSTVDCTDNIGIFNEQDELVGLIEVSKNDKTMYDELPLYRFGLVSDVHNKISQHD